MTNIITLKPTTSAIVTGPPWSNINNFYDASLLTSGLVTLDGMIDPVSEVVFKNYNFNLPSLARIKGYLLTLRMLDAMQYATIDTIRLLDTDGITPTGNNKASGQMLPETVSDITFGGPTDLWGTSFTVSQVNNGLFGIYLGLSNLIPDTTDARGYNMALSVYYSLPGSGNSFWSIEDESL